MTDEGGGTNDIKIIDNNPFAPINWYDLMDKMIGEKKKYDKIITPMTGIPQPLQSREEVRVQRAFESCAFKTAMSCTIGPSAQYYFFFNNSKQILFIEKVISFIQFYMVSHYKMYRLVQ